MFFNISDTTDAPGSVNLIPVPSSSNTTLVPNANLISGTVANTNGQGRFLTITPVGGQPGFTFITLNATDKRRRVAVPETFEVIFDNPPVMPANPGPQTIPHGQTLNITFNITTSGLPFTTTVNAVTVSAIYNLWTQDKFFESGGTYYQNASGTNEKWVLSQTTGKWFTIQPNGVFSVWNGGSSFTQITVDQFGNPLLLDNSYWQDPTKLTAPAAPFSFTAGTTGASPNMTLQVTAPLNYIGPVNVTVSATDGFATSSISFPLTVTNSPPKFNTIGTPTVSGGIPVLNVPPSQPTFTVRLADPAPGGYSLTDLDDGIAAVTLDGSAVYASNSASIAYELAQTYALYFTGNYFQNSAGLNEKWVRSLTTGVWYIIQPSGAFSVWNGGKSFTQLAMLDNSYWVNPTNLVQAPQPPALVNNISIDDVNHFVTLTTAAQEVVQISAFDGQATTTQFFNMTSNSMPPVFSVPNQQFDHNASGNPQFQINLANQPASPAGAVNLTDPNGLPVNSTMTVYNYIAGEAYYLSSTYNLRFNTSYYQDTAGRGEKWLYGQANSTWYIIEPNGNFSKWNGGSSFTFIATLNFSFWSNPNLLINVAAPTPLVSNASFTFGAAANILSFTTDKTFAGNYLISVTAADASSSTTKTFELSITNAAPSFNLTPGATSISHTSSANATINAIADADDGQAAVNISANVYPYIPGLAYELQQTYQFYFTGNYFASSTMKWFRSAVNNSWYIVDPTGNISQWNGGTSFTLLNTLDASYFTDPTKLFNAQLPAALNPASVTVTLTGTNAAGYNLNVAPINASGNLMVLVNGSDNIAVTSKYYKLTVTSPTPSFTLTPNNPSIAFLNTATASITNISAAPDPVSRPFPSPSNVYALIPGVAYQLNQLKAFYFTGNYYLNSAGLSEKWIFSATDNAWYIIDPTGKLSKWNGGSSFTQVVIDGFNVVLGSAYWNDPSLLYNANTAPPDLAQVGSFTTSFSGNNATGLTLTINPHSLNQGNFLIQVTGSDGGVTAQYFVQNFSDFAPTFGQPADQSVSHFVHTYTLDLLNPNSYANPSAVPSPTLFYSEGVPAGNLATVTLAVKAYYNVPATVAYELNSQLNLFFTGNYFLNSAGLGEKWVRSHVNNQWYIIQPNGAFSVWNGGASFTFVAQLDSSYFADPTTLFNAPEPQGADVAQAPQFPTPAVTSYSVNNVNHTVTVNTSVNFVGNLIVKVTAADPTGLSTSQFFNLAMTSLPPNLAFNPASPVALSKTGTPTTVELVGNDPDSGNANPLTYTVSFTDESAAAQAFALQQSLNLYVDGSIYFNFYGQQEIWLRSHTNNNWYAITPDGNVHLLDTKNLLGPVVATLSTAYYNNYQLLLNATQPAALPVSYQLLAAGDPLNPDAMNLKLTWNSPSVPSSGIYPFQVTVKATNSVGASTTQTFTVNVS